MSARLLFILSGAVVLGLSACKKEFVEGDTILVNDTVTATNAETFSFNHGWGGMRSIGEEGEAWQLGDMAPPVIAAFHALVKKRALNLESLPVHSQIDRPNTGDDKKLVGSSERLPCSGR